MKEALLDRPVERPRPIFLSESIEHLVDKEVVSVAEHEFTHITAIWGVGEKTNGATVVPSSTYLGATFVAGEMSPRKMQIAAMASAEHEGNGSDKMKAHLLETRSGMSAEQAESVAKQILSSYRQDVLHIAAMYLAFYGSASDARLREFIRLAEEEVREKEKYKNMPIPSWSEVLDTKVNNNDESENEELHTKTKSYTFPILFLSLFCLIALKNTFATRAIPSTGIPLTARLAKSKRSRGVIDCMLFIHLLIRIPLKKRGGENKLIQLQMCDLDS